MDKKTTPEHSKLSKSLRIQAFESLDGFKMYYAIGTSVSSLHRESTDSPIGMAMVLSIIHFKNPSFTFSMCPI